MRNYNYVEKIVINMPGMAASGKSTLATAIADALGGERYRPSSTIEQYAAVRGIACRTRKDYQRLHAEMMVDEPLAVVTPVILSAAKLIVADAFRCPVELWHLLERREIATINMPVIASQYTRYERATQRAAQTGRPAPASLEAFITEEADEVGDPVHAYNPVSGNMMMDPLKPNILYVSNLPCDAFEIIDTDPRTCSLIDMTPPGFDEYIDTAINMASTLIGRVVDKIGHNPLH